jgi:hypothetical protein
MKDEPRWHLDGKPLEGEDVIMVRDGHELRGILRCDGDTPPGSPIFEWLPDGLDELQRVAVDVATDTFRRLLPDEPKRHTVRRLN